MPRIARISSRQIGALNKLIGRGFVQKIAWTYGNRMLVILIGFASTIITSRILGPEGRGVFSLAITIGSLGARLANLGLPAANTYFLARKPKLLPALLGNSLAAGFLVGGSIAILGWIICDQILEIRLLDSPLLALSLLWIPLSLIYLLSLNLLLGLQAISFYNWIEVASKILIFAAIILLFLLKNISVFNLLIANLIVLLLSGGINILNLYQRCHRIQYFSWSTMRQTFDYGIKGYLSSLFVFMVLNCDVLMIQQVLGSAPVGLYSIAVKMTDVLYLFPGVVRIILFPILSGLSSDSEKWEKVKIVASLVLGAMFLLALLAALFGKWAIGFLFGPDYLGAYPSFLILLPAILILSVNSIIMTYFASLGMPIITIISPAFAFCLNIILNGYWIPVYGIQGAAVSSLLSYLLMLLVNMIFIRCRKLNNADNLC